MNCNSDNPAIDLNNNYLELASSDAFFTDHNQPANASRTEDSASNAEHEFNPSPFQQHNRNVQTRDSIEMLVDTYLFIEKTRSLLLSFCW